MRKKLPDLLLTLSVLLFYFGLLVLVFSYKVGGIMMGSGLLIFILLFLGRRKKRNAKNAPVKQESRSSNTAYAFAGAKAASPESFQIEKDGSLAKYTGSASRAVIPEGVTKIGPKAFAQTAVKEVIIPEGVTYIGWLAFQGCSELQHIVVPDSVENVDYQAFGSVGCDKIRTAGPIGGGFDFEFGHSVALPNNLFKDLKGLTSAAIPEGVTSIGNNCFSGCKQLQKILLPNSIKKIASSAFHDCISLRSITIPASVEHIGDQAFFCCNSLRTAGPIGGGYDFEFGYTDMLPDNLFMNLKGLTKAVIPEGVTSIGKQCFFGCRQLQEVRLPNSLKSFSVNAFYGCGSLRSITLPDGVDGLDQCVFAGCRALADENGFIVIGTTLAGYVGNQPELRIPEGVKRISASLCGGQDLSSRKRKEQIRSIHFPDGLEYIGASAFSGCCSLSEIVLPDGLQTIDSGAFMECSRLKSCRIPDSVRSIGANCFSGCRNLSVEIPDSVEVVGEKAFRDCHAVSASDNASDSVKQCLAEERKYRLAEEQRKAAIREKEAWKHDRSTGFKPREELHVFWDAHAQELSPEAYRHLIEWMASAFPAEYSDPWYGAALRWKESPQELAFRAEVEYFNGVIDDDTTLETCLIQLRREEAPPSEIPWTASDAAQGLCHGLPCDGIHLVSDNSSHEGDRWSYSNHTDLQYLVLRPYGLEGIWRVMIDAADISG